MFKLVCGAGNEDAEYVKRLVFTYASAGCKLFDISARKEILEAAKEGAKLAGADDVAYCVSIGIRGDKHIKKAKIDTSKCSKCANCFRNCPNDAIYNGQNPRPEGIEWKEGDSPVIIAKKCLGCGTCLRKCPTGAMGMEEKDINFREVLPYMAQHGADLFELHIMGNDKDDLARKWQVINECNPKYASICIDREYFGNKEVLGRIREMIKSRKPYTTIVQADGVPMSGIEDTYKTTLQAVAMAEVIQKAELPVHIMLSGGTNSKTARLAKMCGIKYWGIAIGSWARKIVKPYLKQDNFWEDKDAQSLAIEAAKNLINHCK